MYKNTKTKLNTLGKIVESKGVSYTTLAKHFGVSRQAIWRQLHQPYNDAHLRLEFYQKLGDLLGIDTLELIQAVLDAKQKEKGLNEK